MSEEKEILELKPLPHNYVSYSQIRMFKRCPYQYKIRYIDGIKMKPKSQLILGISVHDGLTTGFREKKEKRISDKKVVNLMKEKAVQVLEETSSSQEIDWGDDNINILKDSASMLIKTYYSDVGKKLNIEDVEKKFEIEFENTDWKLVGETDLLTPPKIIDWKCSQRKYADEYFLYDEQLKIYKCVFQKDTEIHALIRKKKDAEIQIIPLQINATKTLLQDIEKVVIAIKTGMFYKTNDYMKCSWCGYRDICQKEG